MPRPTRAVARACRAVCEKIEPRLLFASTTPRQAEFLNRGVIAVPRNTTTIYVSWRQLGNEAASVGYNLYRSVNGAAFAKRNTNVITATTDFTDTSISLANSYAYYVRPVVNGVEGAPGETYTIAANSPVRQYLTVPLQIPAATTNPDGTTSTYSANDMSVGDVDGDGTYEYFVKWQPSDAKDNSQGGYTGRTYLDCYRLNGTRLYRIDLGINIRSGAHYTQYLVYDFDGDGRAELVSKTADGTVDGVGTVIGSATADYRSTSGYILSGPEYLTVFNGLTGAAMATTNYVVPRGTVSSWGDNYGNRVDRFLATTAYLDGQRPSIVMARGYYTRAVLAAFDWRNGQLTQRWVFDTNNAGNAALYGQGAHSISVGDVDDDGKDEIMYGAAAVDDNGTVLYSTTLGHGDATIMTDLIPSRPGQEAFQVHEDPGSYLLNGISYGADVRDARTGELLFNINGFASDVGRGNAFDIDPRYPGAEAWTSADSGIWNIATGTRIQDKPSNMFQNFGIWWDADPLRELLDGNTIGDWVINGTTGIGGRSNLVFAPSGTSGNNGTKNTPSLTADLFGDWREEVIWRQSDNAAFQIWTTTIASTMKLPTLMSDLQYRQSVAWQNVGYNQPTATSYFLGDGMTTPPLPNIYFAGQQLPDTFNAETASFGGGTVTEATNGGYNGTAYLNFPTNNGFLTFSNIPGGVGGAGTIRVRYALGATTARTGTLTVNGTTQNVTFQPTGAWSTWVMLDIPVTLSAGATNTITFRSTGQDLANIDEIVVPPTVAGTLSGTTFQDRNADGIFDAGESAVSGITVYLDSNNNAALDAGEPSTLTSPTGTYAFASVVPGTYRVRAAANSNFVSLTSASTDLASGGSSTVSVPLSRIFYPGTSGVEDYTLRRGESGAYEILLAGALNSIVPATVPSLTFSLSASNDSLTVDYSGGLTLPAGGLSYDAGTGTNTLRIIGTASASAAGITLQGGNISVSVTGADTAALRLSTLVGATLTFSESLRLSALSMTGGRVNLATGTAATLTLSTLAMTGSAAIDLRDNALVLDHAGSSPVADVRARLATGLLGASGILSSTTVADPSGLRAVGYAEAAELFNLATADTTAWRGQSVDASSLLVQYAYAGDTDLDGDVDGRDLSNTLEGFSTGLTGWQHGDVDHDGAVTPADFQRVRATLNALQSPGSLLGAPLTAGPSIGETTGPRLELASQPTDTAVRKRLPPLKVELRTADDALDGDAATRVRVRILSGPADGKLLGTTTARARRGVARFADLSLSKPGTYTLEFSAPSYASVRTTSFVVTATKRASASAALFSSAPVTLPTAPSATSIVTTSIGTQAQAAGSPSGSRLTAPATTLFLATPALGNDTDTWFTRPAAGPRMA